MNNGILIIAHAPLASALRQCVLHVFPDGCGDVVAVDVQPDALGRRRPLAAGAAVVIGQVRRVRLLLVLTDCWAQRPATWRESWSTACIRRLVAGVNLPMLLRTVTYRHEPLDVLVARAVRGGTQGVMQVAATVTAGPKSSEEQNE